MNAGQSTSGTGTTGQSSSWYGVYGQSGTGSGVVGNSSSGYAMEAQGNATQSRSSGGFVKAMALIDPYDAANPIKQCFNSQLPGPQSTSGDCGIVVNMGPNCTGWREVNFGFKVDDRFVFVTPLMNDSDTVTAEIRPWTETTWHVTTSYTESGQSTCAKFFIMVY